MEVNMIQELLRINQNEELQKIEVKLLSKEKMLKNAINTGNENLLEKAKTQTQELIEEELLKLDKDSVEGKLITKRNNMFLESTDDFASKYFETLVPFDKVDVNIDKSKILDEKALDIKNIEFEGIAINEEDIKNITKALNEKGIYLQNRVKEELHITKTFVGNEKEKITFTNYDLGKINEVKISKYGELIKENVKLESGEIRKSVLANHGILVESINNEKVSNNTHITLANNNDKMIVNINGKDKKVRIGAPVETKDCNFNVEFDITLQGKNAVFDNESKAFFKFEDKDKLIDKALKEEIEKKAENILNNEKEVEKIETISL